MAAMTFRFRPMTRADLSLMHAWLNLPHVAAWWGGGATFEAVREEYEAYIDGREHIHPYVVLVGESAIGHIQWMRYSSYPTYAVTLRIEDLGAANCDVLIGEVDFVHRGLGGPLVRQFVREVIFANPDVSSCFIDPTQENHVAIRAYEKAGFRFVRDVDDDGEGHSVHLMELTRP